MGKTDYNTEYEKLDPAMPAELRERIARLAVKMAAGSVVDNLGHKAPTYHHKSKGKRRGPHGMWEA